jgi:hypothetical protein
MTNENSKRSDQQENELVEQPLMSTGTTEPGFDWKTNSGDVKAKPKIGETVIGQKNE